MDRVSLLLDKLTKAISFKYVGKVAPGVLVSYLPNNTYYVSILKFGKNHLDKTVMHSAKDTDLEKAITAVTEDFLKKNSSQTNPVEDLQQHFTTK